MNSHDDGTGRPAQARRAAREESQYSAAHCRAQAAICETEAKRAAYEAQRQQLLCLADQWRALAKLAERVLPARPLH